MQSDLPDKSSGDSEAIEILHKPGHGGPIWAKPGDQLFDHLFVGRAERVFLVRRGIRLLLDLFFERAYFHQKCEFVNI